MPISACSWPSAGATATTSTPAATSASRTGAVSADVVLAGTSDVAVRVAEEVSRRDRDEPGAAAQRVARAVIETLGRIDAEGYVFRVDLRLRPASEVSPLAFQPS